MRVAFNPSDVPRTETLRRVRPAASGFRDWRVVRRDGDGADPRRSRPRGGRRRARTVPSRSRAPCRRRRGSCGTTPPSRRARLGEGEPPGPAAAGPSASSRRAGTAGRRARRGGAARRTRTRRRTRRSSTGSFESLTSSSASPPPPSESLGATAPHLPRDPAPRLREGPRRRRPRATPSVEDEALAFTRARRPSAEGSCERAAARRAGSTGCSSGTRKRSSTKALRRELREFRKRGVFVASTSARGAARRRA